MGDLGPGTHLLNGLRIERDPWAFLVVVDDDHIYSPRLVEDLMRAALAHPGGAVAAQGFLSVPGMKVQKDSPRYLHDQGFAAGPVLVSYLGVVYQRGFFDDSVYDFSQVSHNCMYQDDMWFSAHLARKGIRRWVLGGAMGVTEIADMHLGPSSLTHWQENKPRRVSEECNDSLQKLYADIWSWRRRLVLTVGGLPPLSPVAQPAAADEPTVAFDTVGSSAALTATDEWGQLFRLIKQLPRAPDLVYLCTQHSGFSNQASSDQCDANDGEGACRQRRPPVLGSSFWLDGVLVSASDACEAHAQEPKVGHLLRDALRWEGDPDTVVAVGTLNDISTGAADLAPVADCAAEIYRSEKMEDLAKNEGPQLALAGPAGEAIPLPGAGAGRARVDGISGSPHKAPPFCRMGGFAAVSVGALSESTRM